MVPVLLLLYPDISPDVVTAISLTVVFANATSGSVAYARMKRIDYKAGVLFAIATIPGSVVGARVTAFIPRETFELVFGLFMIAISSAFIGMVAMLAALRGGMWLAGRALRPVGQVVHTARRIVQAEDLSCRVPEADSSDEIGELTRTINAMLARLEQLFTAQHRFVADVSHELHTPLATMRGHLDILQRGARRDPQVLTESLADIQREVLRLTRLTSDLLLLAQVDAGRLRLRRESVALDDLVLDVIRTLHPLCNGVTVTPVIDDQVVVVGDEDRLKQALINLVANTLSHTPVGGRVTIDLSCCDAYACLRVRDTGEGIVPDDIPHLFNRFYRADKARSRRSGGAGIGLTLVKWIAEAHGGRVEVESTPGVGSEFVLILPVPAAAPTYAE